MDWLTSFTKEAGAGGEVQLSLNEEGTIDITTHLSLSPNFASASQEEALDFLQTAFGFSNPEASDLITRAVDTGYSEASIVVEKAMSIASKSAHEIFAIAEDLVSDMLVEVQFERVAANRYLVSGLPDNYMPYVAARCPYLNKLDVVRTAALVWVEAESYSDNTLAAAGRSPGNNGEIFLIYSAAKECRGMVGSLEDLVQILEAAIDRPLNNFDIALAGVIFSGNEAGILDALTEAFPEADRALVELVLSGDRAALTESLTTETVISPENAYMVPQGLPVPAMPGVSYEAKKKGSIPIRLVGQDFWGQEPPSAWLERIKNRTPETPDKSTELRGELNDHKRALEHIQSAREIMQGGAEESAEQLLEEEELADTPELESVIQLQRRVNSFQEAEKVREIWSDIMTLVSDIHAPLLSRMGQDVEPTTYAEADQALARLSYAVHRHILSLADEIAEISRKPELKKPEEVKPTWQGSWERIQKNIPINTLEKAISEYQIENPVSFEGQLTFEDAKGFFSWLLRPDPETGLPIQTGIGDISNPRGSAYWIAYWLTEHGGLSPEQIYGVEPLIP